MQQAVVHRDKYFKLSISIFSAILAILFYLIIRSDFNNTITQMLIPLFFFAIFFFLVNKFKIGIRLKVFALFIFSAKLVLIMIYSNYANIIIFPDSYNYITNLDRIINSGDYSMKNIQSTTGTLHVGHYYYMLIPYLIFGTHLSIIFMNTLITSVSLLLFYRVFQVIFDKKIALFTLILGLFSLNFLLFGGAILKESMVIFLVALTFYMVKVKKKRVIIPIILSVLLITVRIYAGFSVLLAVILDVLFINNKKTSLRVKFFSFIGVSLLIILITSLPAAQPYLNLSTQYMSGLFNMGTIVATAKSIIKFFFSPLPWNSIYNFNIYSILIFDTVIFMMLSIFLLLFLLKFLRYKNLRKKFMIFLIPIIIHAAVLGHTYDGDSARQRSGIFIFLILTIAIGLFYKNKKYDKPKPEVK